MTWMKYPVLAATIAAAGWGFLFLPPMAFAATDISGHGEAIASDHSKGGSHLDHGDHIDPEPDEIKEMYRSVPYVLPFWHPSTVCIEYATACISTFREVPDRA